MATEAPILDPSLATVLVVEDEEPLADLYTEWLGDGYRVLTAYDGETALEMLEDPGDVDVVVLDRRMPGLSGDQVLETIREREFDVTVIMVTAVDPDLNILEMDFDDYLCKPINRETLTSTLSHHVDAPADARSLSRLEEFFSLVSKLIVLEDSMTTAELEADEQYRRLTDRVNQLGNELHEEVEDFDEIVDSFRTIKRR